MARLARARAIALCLGLVAVRADEYSEPDVEVDIAVDAKGAPRARRALLHVAPG